MKLKIKTIDYHRNGVSGIPFYVCLFAWKDGNKNRNMLATIFEETGECAVLDIDELVAGNVAFGSNSWRGDNFEPDLRKAIKARE